MLLSRLLVVCLLQICNDTPFTLTPPLRVAERERERGQVMIYDHDAAFQHRMINLYWEHFTSTSLTYLGLAHACTHACQRAH